MRIAAATAWICELPVEKVRTDAVQAFTKQETIMVELTTDSGLAGIGYSYTIGTGGRSVLALLRTDMLPLLIGEDAREVERLWHKLFWATHATSVGAITSLALAAVDTALWDLRCLAAAQPLWQLAGGARSRIPVYDTEGGWLHSSVDELVAEAQSSQLRGWAGVKIKVGKRDAGEDVERLAAVRSAIGPRMHMMIDVNQAWTYAEALRRARLFEPLDPFWYEEPLPAEDLAGHVRLSAQCTIPIAVGESIYSISHFREYLAAGACAIVQPDVARIGGITPWLKVAHLAEAFNVMVAPHFLMELHLSLTCAVPNSLYLEHIPQLRALTQEAIQIEDGSAIPPAVPGLGIGWGPDAIARYRLPD
ncbi:MAG: mandelate racemase/muconate lactonizing enzyme family protein [Candidatus Dormibacteraeota bacterium]|nr:mandelate racemase/muconate lactonizing enzyme family protein [Candidatus Dormibacteraeota bacterium]